MVFTYNSFTYLRFISALNPGRGPGGRGDPPTPGEPSEVPSIRVLSLLHPSHIYHTLSVPFGQRAFSTSFIFFIFLLVIFRSFSLYASYPNLFTLGILWWVHVWCHILRFFLLGSPSLSYCGLVLLFLDEVTPPYGLHAQDTGTHATSKLPRRRNPVWFHPILLIPQARNTLGPVQTHEPLQILEAALILSELHHPRSWDHTN